MANVRQRVAYGLSDALPVLPPSPVVAKRAPTSADIGYPLGTLWIEPVNTSNTAVNGVWALASIINNLATWVDISAGAGSFASLTVNPGPTALSTVGNGAVTIGNTSNTGLISIVPGTGNFSLAGAAGATIGIGAAAQTGKISIGDSTGALTVDVLNGVAAGAQVLNIGSATPAADVTVNILTSAASAGTQAFNVFGTGATRAGTVNIANGAAAHTVNLGSTNGGATTNINAGTGGVQVAGFGVVTVPNVATAGLTVTTAAGSGAAAVLTSSAATVDALQCTVGGIKVPVTASASGASPRVVSARFGVADFTDVINAAATVALAITNTLSTAASIVMATVQCSTAGSALVIRNIDVSVAGTITLNVTNLGGSNTAADIFVTFWLLN